jgi:hypothetical protein
VLETIEEAGQSNLRKQQLPEARCDSGVAAGERPTQFTVNNVANAQNLFILVGQ